ncbi:MAG TPA: hypothetical protein VNJ04_06270 [Gemmatimonadaceae bacterium]|nr:hypothetical protein [Gemmatimonadaceae bacterium]
MPGTGLATERGVSQHSYEVVMNPRSRKLLLSTHIAVSVAATFL